MPSKRLNAENTARANGADPGKAGQGKVLLMAGLIAALTVAVYAQTRHFDFLSFDDPIYTTENDQVPKGVTWENLVWAFTGATDHSNYWAPLTWLTFMVDYELYGPLPGGYHLTNVLFHAANAVLLFGAFRCLSGRLWESFFLALLFALHPLHVESVAWVSERKDVVSTFFWVLTLWAYAGYARNPGRAAYGVVYVLFLCCLMGKPMGVTLPFVLLLLDYWPLGRYGQGRPVKWPALWQTCRRLVWEKIPFFIVIAIIVPFTYYTQSKGGGLEPFADIPFLLRLENVAVAYISQIVKTFWPLNLGLLYPYPESLPVWQPVAATIGLAGVTGLTMRLIFRYPYLPVGWLWFLGTFVPVAGFVVIGPHVTADRYTYVPLIGIFIMVVWGGADLAAGRRRRRKQIVCSLAVSALCLSAWLAYKQVGHWRNDITIYTHTLAVTKDNWPVHLNIGAAYRNLHQDAAALEHYRRAVRIKPDQPELQLSVGDVLLDMGATAAAIAHYQTALKTIPDSAAIHSALAVAFDKDGRPDRALVHFKKALALNAQFAEAHQGLGVTLFKQGQTDRAMAHYRQALRVDPGHAPAHHNLGVALLSKGDLSRARARFRAAIAADPAYPAPHYALGVLDLRNGDRPAAVRRFRQALEIDPGLTSAQQGLRQALQ